MAAMQCQKRLAVLNADMSDWPPSTFEMLPSRRAFGSSSFTQVVIDITDGELQNIDLPGPRCLWELVLWWSIDAALCTGVPRVFGRGQF